MKNLFLVYDFGISVLQNNIDTFDGNVSIVFKRDNEIHKKRITL